MKRSGDQLQYSEPLQSQIRGGERFGELISKMLGTLHVDWTVEAVAQQAGLSPRQFGRCFKGALGVSPTAHPEVLRLRESRLRLASSRNSMARIAHAVGFRSDNAFQRAFERRFGVTPTAYCSRFTILGVSRTMVRT